MGKIKFTPEKKIEIIEAYKSGKVAYSQLQDVYGMNRNEIYRWILAAQKHFNTDDEIEAVITVITG